MDVRFIIAGIISGIILFVIDLIKGLFQDYFFNMFCSYLYALGPNPACDSILIILNFPLTLISLLLIILGFILPNPER